MSKPKILLVESDGTESRVFVETCECHGLEVMVVANGHEAVSAMENQANGIDLVVTELAMAEGDGLWLQKWMRTNRPRIPIILTTGCFAAQNTQVRGLFDRVFEKPLGPDQWQQILFLAVLGARVRSR